MEIHKLQQLLSEMSLREKIGYGDGWLILGMGMWCSAEEIVSVLLMGCVLCTGAGILRKEKELPFVPFLTAGYIAGRYLLSFISGPRIYCVVLLTRGGVHCRFCSRM